MNTIFLSASIPEKSRDSKYWETCDIISIRDCVISLVQVCIKRNIRIVWGGHPAITPLVYCAIENLCSQEDKSSKYVKQSIQKFVHIFQSNFFSKKFPQDNNKFENITVIPAGEDAKSSLKIMRNSMLDSESFYAGIFIGGMEGVEEEYELFKVKHPKAYLFPIASTGAAAGIIYESHRDAYNFSIELKHNNAYYSLFDRLLAREPMH